MVPSALQDRKVLRNHACPPGLLALADPLVHEAHMVDSFIQSLFLRLALLVLQALQALQALRGHRGLPALILHRANLVPLDLPLFLVHTVLLDHKVRIVRPAHPVHRAIRAVLSLEYLVLRVLQVLRVHIGLQGLWVHTDVPRFYALVCCTMPLKELQLVIQLKCYCYIQY